MKQILKKSKVLAGLGVGFILMGATMAFAPSAGADTTIINSSDGPVDCASGEQLDATSNNQSGSVSTADEATTVTYVVDDLEIDGTLRRVVTWESNSPIGEVIVQKAQDVSQFVNNPAVTSGQAYIDDLDAPGEPTAGFSNIKFCVAPPVEEETTTTTTEATTTTVEVLQESTTSAAATPTTGGVVPTGTLARTGVESDMFFVGLSVMILGAILVGGSTRVHQS